MSIKIAFFLGWVIGIMSYEILANILGLTIEDKGK
jgi:hypothetical protein